MKKHILLFGLFVTLVTSAFAGDVERASGFVQSGGNVNTSKDVVIGDTLTLNNGAYSSVLATSTAEGLAAADFRIGLDEGLRLFCLLDKGDLGVDLGRSTGIGNPTLFIGGASSPSSNFSMFWYNELRVNSGYNFSLNTDISSGNAFSFMTSGAPVELVASNSQQSFVKISANVKQAGTAAFDALHVDISDSESYGDGSSGVGNNLLRLDTAGVNQFRVSTTGVITNKGLTTQSSSESVADDGTIVLPTGVAGWLTLWVDGGIYTSAYVNTNGAVTLSGASASTAGTDSDGNLCIYDGGAGAVIKNRLGSTKTVRYRYMYS